MHYTLPLSEVKAKLSSIIAKVVRRDDEVIITRNGKPAAVIISAEEYEGWRETQEIKRDPEMMAQIKRSQADFAAGRFKTYTAKELDELFGV